MCLGFALWVFLALEVTASVIDSPSQDSFEVRLQLDELDKSPKDKDTKMVNLKIGGHGFNCALPGAPSASSRQSERRERGVRYLASARMAPFAGACLKTEAVADSPATTLCIGDRFSVHSAEGAALVATHQTNHDKPLGSGVSQLYAGPEIKAEVHCRCPEDLHDVEIGERPCWPGDVVEGPHPAGIGRVMARIARDDGAEGLLLERPSQQSSNSTEKWHAPHEEVTRQDVACSQPWENDMPSGVVSLEVKGLQDDSPGGDNSSPMRRYSVDLQAQSCCGVQALREAGFRRLLSPVEGRCVNYTRGWFTYELCYPWQVRKFHLAPQGEVDGPVIVLGRFEQEGSFFEQRSEPRRGRRQRMLSASIEGDPCSQSITSFGLDLEPRSRVNLPHITAVGGTFNPGVSFVKGEVYWSRKNQNGCTAFTESFQGKIALVRRGSCWFHNKALNAQAAGAIGIIIFNDNQQMIEVMEGVEYMPIPRIPTMLIERAHGDRIKDVLLSGETVIASAGKEDPDFDTNVPVSTTVELHCDKDWATRRDTCESGDVIEVKWPRENDKNRAAVEAYRAIIVAAPTGENNTLQVQWQASLDGGTGMPDTTLVKRHLAFKDGASCASGFGYRIQQVEDNRGCHAKIVAHAAALCADPHFTPVLPRERQVINCAADADAKTAINSRISAEQQDPCEDWHRECRRWARVGECEANPTWMHVHCQKSCSMCEGTRSTDTADIKLQASSAQTTKNGAAAEADAAESTSPQPETLSEEVVSADPPHIDEGDVDSITAAGSAESVDDDGMVPVDPEQVMVFDEDSRQEL